jgi:hypothetical protein
MLKPFKLIDIVKVYLRILKARKSAEESTDFDDSRFYVPPLGVPIYPKLLPRSV